MKPALRLTTAILAILSVSGLSDACGATKTWTGGGANNNWATVANWNPAGAPVNGDTLFFPAAASRLNNTNNLSNLRIDSLTVTGTGYNLNGNSLTVSNGLVFSFAAGTVTVGLDVALGASQVFDNRAPVAALNGDINLNGFDLTLDGQDALEAFAVAGVITGNGNVTVTGLGTVIFQGASANTYTGTTTVAGTLNLAKSAAVAAVPQTLTVAAGGRVNWASNEQIPNNNPLVVAGTLNLAGNDETVAALELQGATITTGTGRLTLAGNLTNRAASVSSTISGALHLGNFTRTFVVSDGPAAPELLITATVSGGFFGLPPNPAGIIKHGDGSLHLAGGNTFAGTVIVQAGELRVLDGSALGTSATGTVISSNATLTIGSVSGFDEPLTLGGWGLGGTNGAVRMLSGIAVNAAAIALTGPSLVVVENGGILTLNGVVSGTGGLTKSGPGELRLQGPSGNTFSGTTTVAEGRLTLGKSSGNAIPGAVIVGVTPTNQTTATLAQAADHQIGGDVTVHWTGTWDLDGNDESVTDLTLDGAALVTTGTGVLTLGGDILASPGPGFATGMLISGHLALTTADHVIEVNEGGPVGNADPADLEIRAAISGLGLLTKIGAGDLYLTGSNTYSGLTIANAGELRVGNDLALGSGSSGTRINSNAVLALVDRPGVINYGGVRITNELLELDSIGEPGRGTVFCSDNSAIWGGQVLLHQTAVFNVTTNEHFADWADLLLDGNVSGPGGFVKTGPGRILFRNFGVNDYGGSTSVDEGTLTVARLVPGSGIPGALTVGDGSGGPATAVVNLGANVGTFIDQIQPDAPIHVNGDGLLSFQVRSPTSVAWLTGTGQVEILEDDLVQLAPGGASFAFDGSISGAGRITKFGAGTVALNGTNSLTGETRVSGGTLLINGEHAGSKVTLDVNGRLGGRGSIGDLEAFASTTVAPGASPGQLRAASVNLRNLSRLELELNGPDAGNEHDQLVAAGSLSITNAQLFVTINDLPMPGQTYTIIDKTSPGPVVGTFMNLSEGAVLNFNGFETVLSYLGGDGNDVTLTVTNRYLAFHSATVTLGNGNGYLDPNECNHLTVSVSNRWTGVLALGEVRVDSETPGIIITRQHWPGLLVFPGGVASNALPIQFRTTPELPCGVPAKFSLTVNVAELVRIPFSIYIPAPGAFFAFNSVGTPQPIPDSGSVTSVVQVPSTESYANLKVADLRVGVYATHPRVSDLRLRLITPDGSSILLTTNRGGLGAAYGTNCAASSMTWFWGGAAQPIGAAGAPFVGTFQPEQPLALAQGQPLVGAWQLVAEDSVTGTVGTLECWKLWLVPPFCTDAGGGCESCSAPVAGTLNALQMPQRLALTGAGLSGCGWIKPFPGMTSLPGPFRYATHWFTNTGPATCVSVLVKSSCAEPAAALMASVYTNSFHPDNLLTNYAGDSSLSNALAAQLSFRAGSNQAFVVVVNDTQPAPHPCSNYTLEIYGLPCPPPVLDISRTAAPGDVRLFWSTAYPYHRLEGKPLLTSPNFTAETNALAISSGKYSLTNPATGDQRFYRLRQP